MDFVCKPVYRMDDLIAIMRLLRSENGCPWDREQDHHSIRKNFLEETYEVLEAIDAEDPAMLREELGDVLLQVVFHARIEEEAGGFSFDDVVDEICKKLIRRHPHVFGDVKVDTADQVLTNWDKIKQESKGQTTVAQTLASVPNVFPALMRAQKVQHRAAKGPFFDPKVNHEIALSQEGGSPEEQIGRMLFACVETAEALGVDAEEALTKETDRFIAAVTEQEREESVQL